MYQIVTLGVKYELNLQIECYPVYLLDQVHGITQHQEGNLDNTSIN